MGIKMTNVHIENCGTGIKANGKINMEMNGMSFKNNGKDLDLYVEEGSEITIDQLISTGCHTESITYEEYSSKITQIKNLIDTKIDDFTFGEREKIKTLLDEMENSKDQPAKIKKILEEVSQVGKSTATGLLLEYIKLQLGW